MKVLESNFYLVTLNVTSTSWEESRYVKADSIIEVVNIVEEYVKTKYRKEGVTILKIDKMYKLLESSTKTVTIDV